MSEDTDANKTTKDTKKKGPRSDTLLKVRDNTPLTPGIKRYIRLKEK